jgi:hypothetical protein
LRGASVDWVLRDTAAGTTVYQRMRHSPEVSSLTITGSLWTGD